MIVALAGVTFLLFATVVAGIALTRGATGAAAPGAAPPSAPPTTSVPPTTWSIRISPGPADPGTPSDPGTPASPDYPRGSGGARGSGASPFGARQPLSAADTSACRYFLAHFRQSFRNGEGLFTQVRDMADGPVKDAGQRVLDAYTEKANADRSGDPEALQSALSDYVSASADFATDCAPAFLGGGTPDVPTQPGSPGGSSGIPG